jgi:hypothetical protein
MPSTSPMPPKNLAAVRISDRSTETQTQTGYPPIDGQRRLDAALAGPGTWVVVLRTRREVRAFLEATGPFLTNRVALPRPITHARGQASTPGGPALTTGLCLVL